MKATTEFDEITVFGARGHSLMILRALDEQWRGKVRLRALIDDIDNGFLHPVLNIPVISSAQRRREYPGVPVLLTIAKPALRRRIAQELEAEGATFATAIWPDLPYVDPTAVFGPGTVCAPWTRIGPRVTIGAGGLMLGSAIGHDVSVGDFATISGEATVLGHVRIGAGVNIAPRAVIANGSPRRMLGIGDGAEIGVGAVVAGHVATGARMIGNPAMPVRYWVRLRRLLRGPAGREAP